jgi:outer membrane immunogenic protein
MRRVHCATLAAVAVVGFASVAFAADMPAKAPVYKASMAAATPWTGFYVNGGIGYGMWAADTTTVFPTTGLCLECTTQVQGGKGWLGVLGAGFDYQFTPQIVAGVFADANISSLKGTIQDGVPEFAGEIKQTSAWAVGARAGWLNTPMVMSYLNAGYSGARFSGASMVNTASGTSAGYSTSATTMNGWFLGGGVEAAIAPGWFWRNEYRYAYYGSKTLADTGPAFVASITFKPIVQTITTQLVYKFDPGHMAPVYQSATPVMAASWTGFYLNGGFGYGLWAADTTTLHPDTGTCLLCATQVQGGKGYLGVIGAGYDYQFSPQFVAGVFADVDYSSLKGSIQDQIPQWMGEIKQSSAWAAGVRAGWLVTPSMLAYVNGGYSGARFSGTTMVSENTGSPTANTTQGFTRNGGFIGVGAETTAPLLGKNWFWRTEYRYASYGTQTLPDTGPGIAGTITFKPVVQTVTSSIVFKLN